MNAPGPSSPAPPSGWRSGLNAVLLILGLSAVMVVVSMKNNAAPSAAPLSSPAPASAQLTASDAAGATSSIPSTAEILAAIPAPDPATDPGKALTKSIGHVRKNPQNPAAWTLLGDMLAQAQRDTSDPTYYDHAEKSYQAALKLKPAATDAMAGMAWVLGGRHQFDLSILWAEKALALDPGNTACQGILGDAAVELGDYDKAFDHYQKMMDLRPDLSSWSRGAQLLWLTGQQTRATMLMEQAIRSGAPFAENTAWCRARLAMMYFHDGLLPSAIGALQPVLTPETRNPHVLLAAGRIAAAMGDYATAEGFYQKVNAASPGLEALAALGDIQAIQGNAAAAEAYYVKVETLHRQHRETGIHDHMEMARFLADHDRSPAEALRLAVEHGEARNVHEIDTLAWVYFRNGDQTKAIETIKRALKIGSPDASIHFHAACIAAKFGDRTSAQKHLETALSENPHFSLLLVPQARKMQDDYGNSPPPSPSADAPAAAASRVTAPDHPGPASSMPNPLKKLR